VVVVAWEVVPLTGITLDPAAGVQVADIRPPKGEIWQMESLKFRAVNAAAAANRYAVVRLLGNNTLITAELGPPAASIISETHTYTISSTYTQRNETTGVVSVNNGAISGVVLDSRCILRVVYVNINAGDNLEYAAYRYRRWL